MIAAERQKLPKLGQDETLDKNGPGFLGSSDHASPAPSPQTPEIDVKLEDCTRRLLDACHHVSMDPNNSADRALDVCSSVARQVGMPTNTTSGIPSVASNDAMLSQLLACAVRRLCASVHDFNMTVRADFMASYRLQTSAVELKAQIDRAIKTTTLEHDEALRKAIRQLHEPTFDSHRKERYKWTGQQDFQLIMEIQRAGASDLLLKDIQIADYTFWAIKKRRLYLQRALQLSPEVTMHYFSTVTLSSRMAPARQLAQQLRENKCIREVFRYLFIDSFACPDFFTDTKVE